MALAATGSHASLVQGRTDSSPDAAADLRVGSSVPPWAQPQGHRREQGCLARASDQAKAALAATSSPPAIEVPKSQDEIIQKRSEALASNLKEFFRGEYIRSRTGFC